MLNIQVTILYYDRTKGWLMVDSPVPTLTYISIYLIIVYLGPKCMKNKKPFKLTSLLITYNVLMTLLNLYIAIEILITSSRLHYSYICQPLTFINNIFEYRLLNAIWWYYFSKLLEFSDTIFFILRKKDRQLTFLHVYHHSTMFALWWTIVKWIPTGSIFLAAMVNCFIHVLMYSYYALSALGPKIEKYLWWKKYLTILQLVQFTTALFLGIHGIKSECAFPKWMQYVLVVYMISFLALFGNFYAKAYVGKGAVKIKNNKNQNFDHILKDNTECMDDSTKKID
ncbi:elongation of very long chain fatty acids protein 4-like isoform X2 [Adelges cooleyi]|uniref:elongation of very long chain fatty acids protein 4-like isoform X2 n=1 Tax=Adelges cooleyi TaxID=133065 RepID=UPI00217F30DF|nr:elongation of very long chain fatty acids protein 4-like isoform X2 [Adelges cooleyi]